MEEVIEQIKGDFYTGPDHETLLLSEEDVQGFWIWFTNNAITYESVEHNSEGFENDQYLGGRCFGNAQTEAINKELGYLEGFAFVNERFIFHGFNSSGNSFIDVTALNNPEDFLDYKGALPSLYFGIKIPVELIYEENEKLIQQEIKNIPHLIYKYYRASKAET